MLVEDHTSPFQNSRPGWLIEKWFNLFTYFVFGALHCVVPSFLVAAVLVYALD